MVYKLAFVFSLSPRTYNFIIENRLKIDWRYIVLLSKYRTIVDLERQLTSPLKLDLYDKNNLQIN